MRHLLLLSCLCFSCGTSSKTAYRDLPKQDLLIAGQTWKEDPLDKKLGIDPGSNIHSFTITNTSATNTYKKIDLDITYFNSGNDSIGATQHRVIQTIKPKETIVAGNQYVAFVFKGTASAKAKIAGAQQTN